MIYKYADRYMVEFKNRTRASYSKKRYGELLEKIAILSEKEDRKIWNYYEIKDSICYVYYWEQKTQSIKTIIIDVDDKNLVYQYYWQLNCNGYPMTRTYGEKQYLYHLILGTEDLIDHINHNPLDNRKQNLRVCNNSDNSLNQKISKRNTSGITGVGFCQRKQKWRARIQYKYKEYTKYFNTKEEAIKQRQEWEVEFGKPTKTFND